MIRLYTDFNETSGDGKSWLFFHNRDRIDSLGSQLGLRAGDRVALFFEDIEVDALVGHGFIDMLGRDAWFAIPDWSTRRAAILAVVFDAFGTLLDVESAARRHVSRLGPQWLSLAKTWRTKQLEYTWVRSLARRHSDFARITDDALAFAAAQHGLRDTAVLANLRAEFDHLDAYPDVEPALQVLHEKGMRLAVLSNGTPSMLNHQLRSAGLEALFETVMSVEEVPMSSRAFKPADTVYALATDRLALNGGHVAFISSNAWDVFGAQSFGLRAHWVNRRGQPSEYGLAVPTYSDLAGVAAAL